MEESDDGFGGTSWSGQELDLGFIPKRITVSDDKTFNLIEDFCRKCDIKLKKAKSLPQLDEDCMMMLQGMMLGIM